MATPPPPSPTTAPLRLEQLVSAGLLLTSELSLEGVLQRVAELACRIIGARYSAIGVLSDDHLRLEAFVTTGIDQETRARLGAPPEGKGVLGLVLRERKVIRLADLAAHPDSVGFPPGHPPMRSFLGVPIERRRGVFGILYLTEKVDGPEFTAEDERVALLLAAQAGAAVENARLHEESARLLEEVQQLQRSRERFFAMVNHELRNALAGVYGWAEMMVRKKDPATVPKAAFEVLDSADQAIALVNDLLDLSRLDEDRLKPVIREVEPSGMVQRATGRITPLLETKAIQLELEAPERVGTIQTDAHRVEQILINLLGNAIRHAPAASRITLRLLARNSRVLIEVLDEGPGVAEEELDRIFDIYQTKGHEGGVGLGLPLSRRLARLLGGDLRAEARPGTGGCFILELPAGGGLKLPS
jgi:signal transduction histidine kinase